MPCKKEELRKTEPRLTFRDKKALEEEKAMDLFEDASSDTAKPNDGDNSRNMENTSFATASKKSTKRKKQKPRSQTFPLNNGSFGKAKTKVKTKDPDSRRCLQGRDASTVLL